MREPYRTGAYLIYDILGKQEDFEHFRSGWTLNEHPYKASGSHQLNAGKLAEILKREVVVPHHPSLIFLVDLREETHGFFDGVAVSWYADNDFGNVGQPLSWIRKDEGTRLALLTNQTTQVFALDMKAPDNRDQQRVAPTSYQEIVVGKAETEEAIARELKAKIGCPVTYVRIPVTDHCAPSDAAVDELRAVANKVTPNDWVHFHCHGGDGRTTTFLAMYDMWCWKKANYSGYLSLEGFACRQCELFSYCLNPHGCLSPTGPPCGKCSGQPVTGWKRSLALERWKKLQQFHDNPLGSSVG